MKHRRMAGLLACGGAMVLCATTPARAEYTGLAVTFDHNDSAGHDIFRVYAEFTGPNDYVACILGNIAHPMVIQSRDSTDSATGSAFYNGTGTLGSNNTAPYDPTAGGGTHQHGTFVTMGIPQVVGYAEFEDGFWQDQTGLIPGFQNFISGNQLSNNNIGWATTGPAEQARTGHINDGNDTLTRALIMQLSVNSGGNVRGTVAVLGFVDAGLAGLTTFASYDQTFNSYPVPAPGGLALVAPVAPVIVCGRRRRGD